jgi:glycosyltransferase involved in cell wall biosynthesis
MPDNRVSERPCLPDVGVLAFVPDRWEIPWQPRHQVLARLARYFHVVWVTPPVWWRNQLRNSPRQAEVFGTTAAAGESGLNIFRPPQWLPEIGRPAALAGWTTRERLRRARRILERRGCRKTIVYIWRPSFAHLLNLVPHDLSCYHIDDEYTFSEREKPLDDSEARLISSVDQVFIHSPALMAKKGHLNANTVSIPNGVDYAAFATPECEPVDLAQIPRPRVGYVGRIKQQLDLPLLLTLARRHAGWSFVLIGPVENLGPSAGVMRELRALPNVRLLGPKRVQQLPAYAQHLDVCMLCYVVDDYTKFIYPLKLHEYLATGRPVVGAPIESLRDFAGVVRLATGADEWSRALSDALAPSASSANEVARRRGVAREHDWDGLVHVIARTLCSRLGSQYRDRLTAIAVDTDSMPPPARVPAPEVALRPGGSHAGKA